MAHIGEVDEEDFFEEEDEVCIGLGEKGPEERNWLNEGENPGVGEMGAILCEILVEEDEEEEEEDDDDDDDEGVKANSIGRSSSLGSCTRSLLGGLRNMLAHAVCKAE